MSPVPKIIRADATGTVTLPVDATMDSIAAVGRDLRVSLSDGSILRIVGGALRPPRLVLDDQEMEPGELAALLNVKKSLSSLFPNRSSGGNFSEPVDPMQPGFPRDLQLTTEFGYLGYPYWAPTHSGDTSSAARGIQPSFLLGDLQPATEFGYLGYRLWEPGRAYGNVGGIQSSFPQGNLLPPTEFGFAVYPDWEPGYWETLSLAAVPSGGDSGGTEGGGGDDGPPSITVTKDGPATIPEGGADVSFSFTIRNDSAATDPVTVTAINDRSFTAAQNAALWETALAAYRVQSGNPAATAIVLQAGQALAFDYTVFVTMNAGARYTNTVVVTAVDDDGVPTEGRDDHTVGGDDVPPAIDVTKDGPDRIPDGGANVTYVFTLRNDSVATDPVTINSINDLAVTPAQNAGLWDAALAAYRVQSSNPAATSIVLQPGMSLAFDYTVFVIVAPTAAFTNKVEVTAVDDEGNPTQDGDDHTVVTPPQIFDLTPRASGGDVFVDEANLPTGSSPDTPAIGAGTFTIWAPDGVASLTIGGELFITSDVFSPHSITTPFGSTLSITAYDAATGVVTYTYTLAAAETHLPGDGRNDLFEDFPVVLMDLDGDTVSSTLSARIIDDLPTIAASGARPSLEVDETVLATDDSESFAAAFTSAYGADGPGTITYALGVVAGASGLVDTATGEAVNLSLAGGVVEGRTATGNDLVFTLSVAADGTLALDQQRAVVHPITTNPNDAVTLSADDLITLTATITDHDGDSASVRLDIGQDITFLDDGPAASASTPATAGQLTLDETDLTGAGLSTSADFSGNFGAPVFGADGPGTIAHSFLLSRNGLGSGLYAVDPADRSGNDGDGIGRGAEILLHASADGTTITGSTAPDAAAIDAGNTFFTLTVDPATGHVTFTQTRNIWHPDAAGNDEPAALELAPGALQLVQTTDADGDRDESGLDLSGGIFVIEDDGPAAVVEPVAEPADIVVDETVGAKGGDDNAADETAAGAPGDAIGYAVVPGSALFVDSSTGGADGVLSKVYALTLQASQTGLTDMLSGQPVFLFLEGGQIVGRFGVDAAAAENGADNIVFTIAAGPANGNITVTQFRSLDHGEDDILHDGEVSLDAGLVGLAVTITDGDGDTDSDSIELGGLVKFEDDGPTAVLALVGGAKVAVDETAGAKEGDDNADDETTVGAPAGAIGYASVAGSALFIDGSDPGSDGLKENAYALVVRGDGRTGLYLTGAEHVPANEIVLVASPVIGVVEGRVGAQIVFTVAIDPADGGVTVTQYLSLHHPTGGSSHDEPLHLAVGKLSAMLTVTDGDDDIHSATVDLGGDNGAIAFEDDGPTAADDTASTTENTPVTFGVFGNDAFGADGVDTDNSPNVAVTFTQAANGSVGYDAATGQFTYAPGASFGGGVDSFTYTITDIDGDTSTATVTVTVQDQVLVPTVELDTQSLTIKEDSSGSFQIHAATQSSTDELSTITFANLPTDGWGVQLTGPDGPITVTPDASGGFTYDVAPGTQSLDLTVQLTPPADSDADVFNLIGGDITVTASTQDISNPALTADSAAQTVNVDVDAVLDQYVDVESEGGGTLNQNASDQPQTILLGQVIDAAVAQPPFTGAAGTTALNGGEDTDGSEITQATLLFTNGVLPPGVTVSLPDGPGPWDGVVLEQTAPGFGGFTLTGTASQVTAAIENLNITVPGGFDGIISGSILAASLELNTTGAEDALGIPPLPDSGTEPDETDNVFASNQIPFTINVITTVPPEPAALFVFENALDTVQGGNDLAPGLTTGSNPGSPNETDSGSNTELSRGQLVFDAGAEDISSVTFADPASINITNLDLLFSINALPAWERSADGRTLTLHFFGDPLVPGSGESALVLQLGGDTTAAAGDEATVTITATLIDRFGHQSAPLQQQDVTISNIVVVATDPNGDTQRGSVTVNVADDTPVAADEPVRTVVEGAPAISGNVITDTEGNGGADTPGADGARLTSVTIAGTTTPVAESGTTTVTNAAGAYTFTADGAWTFTPAASLNNPFSLNALFQYTLTDGDGDTATAFQPINVEDGPGPVASADITLTLDDENLPTGTNPDPSALTQAGTITFTPGSEAIASIAFATDLSALDSGLTWERLSDTAIVGRDGADTIVTLTLSVSGATATVSATLNDNYDSHPGIDADDLQALGWVGLVATDTDGSTATAAVNLQVSDDVPTTVDVTEEAQPGQKPALNAIMILDLSGSMSSSPGAGSPYATRLALMKAAATNLLQSADVDFKDIAIFTFSSSGTFRLRTTDTDAAITQIQGLSATGVTNYDAAAEAVLDYFENNPELDPDADFNFVYFLTDGVPSTSLDPATQSAWGNFLDSTPINTVFSIGFSGISDTEPLEQLAPRPQDVAQIVSDADTLAAVLGDTLPAPASGNIFDEGGGVFDEGGGFGADGGQVLSITYGGVTYTYQDGGPSFVTITDEFGGILTFHFVDNSQGTGGSWAYTPPEVLNSDFEEVVFDYVATDGDGDTKRGSLTIELAPSPIPLVSNLTVTETGISFNITDPDDTSFTLTAPFAAAFGNPALTLGSNALVPAQQSSGVPGNTTVGALQISDDDHTVDVLRLYLGASGGHTVNAGGGSPVAMYGFDGNDNLTGGAGNDWIFGGAGTDTLNGGAGNDVLVGGAGNDSIVGGAGGDRLTGGDGVDRFVIAAGDSTPAIGGSGNNGTITHYDIIVDFTSTGGSADKLDFSPNAVNATTTTGANGTNSSLTIGGNQVSSHAISSSGIVTFDDANSYSTALSLTSFSNVAAAAQYLQSNDIGNSGSVVAFHATIDGTAYTFIYHQGGNTQTNGMNSLVALEGITISNLSALISGSTGVIDPLVLDLDGNGFGFTSLDGGISFDIDADGVADQLAWNSSNDGLLALDLNGNGVIDDGAELFTPWFTGGSFAGGVAALASLDDNGDGVIDRGDAIFESLRIWQDMNTDGVSDPGELASLSSLGIDAINTVAEPTDAVIDGQTATAIGDFLRTDGTRGNYIEVQLDRLPGQSAFTSASERSRTEEARAAATGLGHAMLVSTAATAAATEPAQHFASQSQPTFEQAGVLAHAPLALQPLEPSLAGGQSTGALALYNAVPARSALPVLESSGSSFDSAAEPASLQPPQSEPLQPDTLALLSDSESPAATPAGGLLDTSELALPSPDVASITPPARNGQASDTQTNTVLADNAEVNNPQAGNGHASDLANILADALQGGNGAGPSIDELLAKLGQSEAPQAVPDITSDLLNAIAAEPDAQVWLQGGSPALLDLATQIDQAAQAAAAA